MGISRGQLWFAFFSGQKGQAEPAAQCVLGQSPRTSHGGEMIWVMLR
jgi:hypothetical protein